MIVLDENAHRQSIMENIATWYRGRVISITALRPNTVIKDEAIPTLLRGVRQPTFVTTNVVDFWRHVPAQNRYCVVCVVLPKSDCMSCLTCCDGSWAYLSSKRKPDVWAKSSE